MKLRCLYFKRRLAMYADGEISRQGAARIEDHLVDCGNCRAILLRLRAGQRFAREIPRRRAAFDQWPTIEGMIAAEEPSEVQPTISSGVPWWRPARVSVIGGVLALASLSLFILTVIVNRQSRPDSSGSAGTLATNLDLNDFHAVSIPDIGRSTEPHVVAEGYVSDVRIDDEDGDLVFKLVDDVKRPAPFIICEIISPLKIAPPPVGSRVRVYGVSRYDGKADHQWYEVHPVLDIEMVRR